MSDKRSPNITISAKVSAESAQGWKKFCSDNGITLSAFIEVAGLQLLGETAPPIVEERQIMVEKARQIDQERRIRKR